MIYPQEKPRKSTDSPCFGKRLIEIGGGPFMKNRKSSCRNPPGSRRGRGGVQSNLDIGPLRFVFAAENGYFCF